MTNDPKAVFDIAIAAYPNALLSAVHGLSDMVQVANMQSEEQAGRSAPRIRLTHWRQSESGAIESASAGEVPGKKQAIIIPPTLGALPVGERAGAFPAWLRARHAEGAILASVCGGAYLLAETGLVSGRTITTHWSHGDLIKQAHPDVLVDVNRLLIDQGDIITAGGMMAWVDLGLNFVDRFLGNAVMLATARFMLIDPGARQQSYYATFKPRLDHGDTSILEVQHWLHGADIKGLTLHDMADRAGLGDRTFLRRFQKATGFNPTEYCQRVKMAKSRDMLIRPNVTLEQVAWESGYEDTQSYRKVFRKVFGLSPSEYRMRFAAGGANMAHAN